MRAGVDATVGVGYMSVGNMPIPDPSSLESGRKAQMVKFGDRERAVQNDVFASFSAKMASGSVTICLKGR